MKEGSSDATKEKETSANDNQDQARSPSIIAENTRSKTPTKMSQDTSTISPAKITRNTPTKPPAKITPKKDTPIKSPAKITPKKDTSTKPPAKVTRNTPEKSTAKATQSTPTKPPAKFTQKAPIKSPAKTPIKSKEHATSPADKHDSPAKMNNKRPPAPAEKEPSPKKTKKAYKIKAKDGTHGFAVRFVDQEWIVAEVQPNTPANRKLLEGDRIDHVNSVIIDAQTTAEEMQILLNCELLCLNITRNLLPASSNGSIVH